MKKIKKDEWILIEPYINRKYEKFINNNFLCNNNTDNNVSYFMNWNWVRSKGEKLICDNKGVNKKVNRNLLIQLLKVLIKNLVNQTWGLIL